jgi:hypothetical protein
VALLALLAGCSGPTGSTSAERSICKTVRTQLGTQPWTGPLPAYAASEAKQLLGGSTSAEKSVVFVRTSFVHELIESHDPTFQRLGQAVQRDAGVGSAIGQLDARCSTLRL